MGRLNRNFKKAQINQGRSQVKSSHLYLYSAFNNTDCVKALNSIKLEDRVSVMYNPKSEKVGTVWKTQIKKESSDF